MIIMDDKSFEKIQEIYSAITAIYSVIDVGDKKQERLYLALHDLNAFMQEQGCKKFELSYKSIDSLTKKAALKAMRSGQRITHRLFTQDEFIEIKGGNMIDEKGNTLDIGLFLNIRNNDKWEDGWMLFKPETQVSQ